MTDKPELIAQDSQFLYLAESPTAWINREPNPRFVSGHDLPAAGRLQFTLSPEGSCRKLSVFVSGHDFSRAVRAEKLFSLRGRGFSPDITTQNEVGFSP